MKGATSQPGFTRKIAVKMVCGVSVYLLSVTFHVRRRQSVIYIGYGRLCVCVAPSLLSHTTARIQMYVGGMVGVPSSCALLGGFAISARVSLL